MAKDKLLSQDQTIALSKDENGEPGATKAADLDLNVYKTVMNLIAEQAATVLIAVLNKEVSVRINQVVPTDPKKLITPFALNALIVNVPFLQGAEGGLQFVFSKADVAALADLMMMGDGSAGYEDDFKNAFDELINQIMDAVCAAFGAQMSAEMAVEKSAGSDFNPQSPELEWNQSVTAELSLSVKDVKDSRFLVIANHKTAASLCRALTSASDKASTAANSPAETGLTMAQFQEPQAQTSNAVVGGGRSAFSTTGNANIDMLLDVHLDVSIELGRTRMSIKRILDLGPGAIVELNRMAGEPVDLLVNDKVVAKGEVVVVDENFGIRIVSLVSPEERLKSLR